jgi:hypothetical protein
MRFSTKLPTSSQFQRLSKKHKITAAGAVAAAAVVLTVTGLEATAGAGSASAAGDTSGVSAAKDQGVKTVDASVKTGTPATPATQKAAQDAAHKKAAAAAAKKKAAAAAAKKHALAAAAKKAAAQKKAAAHKKALAAADRAKAKAAAARSAKRAELHAHAVKAAAKHAAAPKHAAPAYANNLDGWIRQSLDILHAKHIPASYNGIHRNIIRESSGNPQAINLWDINAQNGIPSKGLLQVIDPTFRTYHVAGTSWNIYNPVANITAACNYAADKYGSMDNVNSAY